MQTLSLRQTFHASQVENRQLVNGRNRETADLKMELVKEKNARIEAEREAAIYKDRLNTIMRSLGDLGLTLN